MNGPAAVHDYDVIVIGSGFGGSVAALRLTEKGYRVGVLEAGRRFGDASSPRTSWDVRRFLWAPKLGCHGHPADPPAARMWSSSPGPGSAAARWSTRTRCTGRNPARSTATRSGPRITDWKAELAPYYDQAERMLGVVREPDDDARGRGR